MKKLYILILFLVSSAICLNAQAIRKNYQEMTETEKLNLVNAFYQLRTGADLFNDLATFHANYFVFDNTDDPNGLAIHLNLPDRPENDIFFAWHRRQMFELEQAMQDINPTISIPFWDSSIDQSVNSPLWDQNFMGQFDADWNLGRNIGASGPLPTPQVIVDLQANTDFLLYSNDMERGDAHTGGHRFAGGEMRTGRSPRDPVFYLHHTNVDRLWAEWQNVNQSSSFIRNSMIRYDGTYVFDGVTLPLVNPNDIVDPKVYGTFYALNQLVGLEDYTVNNTYNSQEVFYYQFTIRAGNDFIIPSGNDCKIESVNEIILEPGFEAASGSSFVASIDTQSSNRLEISKREDEIVRNQRPFDDLGEPRNLYDDIFIDSNRGIGMLRTYPNPFIDKINVQFNENLEQGKVIIYNIMGQSVKERAFRNINTIQIANLNGLSAGLYVIKILNNNNETLMTRKLIKL